MDKPEQRPEGWLIAAALKRSNLSARKASQLAGMSDGRWGQIVRGYQTMGDGVYAPVKAPAETIARMAKVVGVTPEQLEDLDRADAAEELRQLLAEAPPEPEGSSPAMLGLPEDHDERVAELSRRVAELAAELAVMTEQRRSG